MKNSDSYPFHYRQITPWYAASAVCWVLMIFMLAIFGFALVGISVARSQDAYNAYLWVPVSLCTISAGGVLLLGWRLVRRRLKRRSGQTAA